MKLSSLLPQMACALLLMASCSQEDSMTPGENPSSVGGIHITTQVSDIVTRGITETATLQNFGICILGSGEHASSLQYNPDFDKMCTYKITYPNFQAFSKNNLCKWVTQRLFFVSLHHVCT